jgi:hypothetical protein
MWKGKHLRMHIYIDLSLSKRFLKGIRKQKVKNTAAESGKTPGKSKHEKRETREKKGGRLQKRAAHHHHTSQAAKKKWWRMFHSTGSSKY